MPFSVIVSPESHFLEFRYGETIIDSKYISLLVTIFEALQTRKLQSLDDLGTIIPEETCTKECNLLKDITINLLTMEDGYIRYDHDDSMEHKNNHPIYHLDICYSNAATYKIGLEQSFLTDSFIQFLDNYEPRYFLKQK